MLIIEKSVLKTLALHNNTRDIKSYNMMLEQCLQKYEADSLSEEGLNLLSVFIKTSSFPNVKYIDVFYKKGFMLQEQIIKDEKLFNYVHSIFSNKQKSRIHYFDQSEIPFSQRLVAYCIMAGKYKTAFLDYYHDKENIQQLNDQSLLNLFFGLKIIKCKEGRFEKYIEEISEFLKNLNAYDARLINDAEFDNAQNIKNFCLNFAVNKSKINYEDIHYIPPYELKEAFLNRPEYQEIRQQYDILRINVEKLLLEKRVLPIDKNTNQKRL